MRFKISISKSLAILITLLLTFSVSLFYCQDYSKIVRLSGKISNPNSDNIMIRGKDFKKVIKLSSEGEFSAEVDPDNPYTFNIYSSKGTEIDQISMSVDKTVDGKGITPISSVPLQDKKPWAFPVLSTWDTDESNRVNLSSVSTNENNGSTLSQNLVFLCDGR